MAKLFPRGDDPSGRKITDTELAALMHACIAREQFYWWCRDFAFSRSDLGVEYGRVKIVEEHTYHNTRGYFLHATFLVFSGVRQELVGYDFYFEADLPENEGQMHEARSLSQRSFIALLH